MNHPPKSKNKFTNTHIRYVKAYVKSGTNTEYTSGRMASKFIVFATYSKMFIKRNRTRVKDWLTKLRVSPFKSCN